MTQFGAMKALFENGSSVKFSGGYIGIWINCSFYASVNLLLIEDFGVR